MKKVKLFEKFISESVSMEAVYIHSMTGSGQQAAQDFIDDNNLDAKKIVDYIKQNKGTIEGTYNIRDLIAGVGVGALKGWRKRMLKNFK